MVHFSDNMKDRALNKAIILDTELDVITNIGLICNSCGDELSVTKIIDEAERGVMLEIEACSACTSSTYHHGYMNGHDAGRADH